MGFTRFLMVWIICLLILSCSKPRQQAIPGIKTITTNNWNYGLFTFLPGDGSFIVGMLDSSKTLSISKYDDHANKIISKQYFDFDSIGIFSSVFMLSGNLVVSGFNASTEEYSVSSFDKNLELMWHYSHVITTSSGSLKVVSSCSSMDSNIFIVLCAPNSNTTSAPACYLTKLNAINGSILNAGTTITQGYHQYVPEYISSTADGLLLSGYYLDYDLTSSTLFPKNGFCMKIHENGSLIWNSTDSFNNVPNGIQFIANHNLVVEKDGSAAGISIYSKTAFTLPLHYDGGYNGQNDYSGAIVATKYDGATGKSYSKTFDVDSSASLPIICSTADGGYLIAATGNWSMNSDVEPTYGILIKTDDSFNVEWQKKYNNVAKYQNFSINNVVPLNNGYEMICLMSYKVNGSSKFEISILKTDLNGNILD